MLPARLPIPLPPARHELATSYVSRLATVHGLGFAELWAQLSAPEHPATTRRRVLPETLAALTGRPRAQLAGALPELRDPAPNWALFRHEPQPGCPLCDARHPGGPVIRLLPHHRYVCQRHRHWIGPPDITAGATPLAALPEILRAQHRHLRLLRRHGWAAIYDAVLTGFLLCAHLWTPPIDPDIDACFRWDERLDVLIADPLADFTASRLFAVVYPEAVALAGVLAPASWRHLAHGEHHQRQRFLAEIGRRLGGPPYRPAATSDAVEHWMSWDAPRPSITPPRTYLDTRARCCNRVFTPGKANQARHDRSAFWFVRQPDGGNVILHHRHVRPVLIRPWSPPMANTQGAIWASTTLDPAPQADLAECAT